LAISAHWYIPACAVTASLFQGTIPDFGGFPEALYQVEYPAPGSPELALHVKDLLSPGFVELDESRGRDHGTWAVLSHVFPDAVIPIVRLSFLEKYMPCAWQWVSHSSPRPLTYQRW
jgi:4,5-DOPA dioxygenase extradiol